VGAAVRNGDLAPDIKKKLMDKIPTYMMPQFWQQYDKLPRNGNGKIDRKKLSEKFET